MPLSRLLRQSCTPHAPVDDVGPANEALANEQFDRAWTLYWPLPDGVDVLRGLIACARESADPAKAGAVLSRLEATAAPIRAAVESASATRLTNLRASYREPALPERLCDQFNRLPGEPPERYIERWTEFARSVEPARLLAEAGMVHSAVDCLMHQAVDDPALFDPLKGEIDERTRLIALTHVPTSGGLVNPAAEVGRIAREAGVLYLLDACQSAGQLPLDVTELGCDLLTVTGRKFLRAPRGTGFLFVRRGVLEQLSPQRLDGRSATWSAPDHFDLQPGAIRFELFEANFALRAGLGAAIDHALGWGLEAIAQRTSALAASMRAQLLELGFVNVRDQGRHQCGIVTFDVDNLASLEVQAALAARNVNVSVTKAVAAQFDLGARGLDSLVRASPHYYNTEAEVHQLVEVVASLKP